jgi:carboxylesterase type B
MAEYFMLFRSLATVLCTFLFLLHANGADTSSTGPLVTVENGTYAGKYVSEWQQDQFLGIPYAIPPLGSLRFARPESLNTSFTGIRNATQYGFSMYTTKTYFISFNVSQSAKHR